MQLFLDLELSFRKDISDTLPGPAVAEQGRALVSAMFDLPTDGAGDLGTVIADIDDVGAMFTAALPCADIDDGHAEECPLAKPGRGVTDHAGRIVDQPRIVLRAEIPVEMDRRLRIAV